MFLTRSLIQMEYSLTKVVKLKKNVPLIIVKGKLKGHLLWDQLQQLQLTRICHP